MSDEKATLPGERPWWRRPHPVAILVVVILTAVLLPNDIRQARAALAEQSSTAGGALVFGAAVGAILFRAALAWLVMHLIYRGAGMRGLRPFAKPAPSPEVQARAREQWLADEIESKKSGAAIEAILDAYAADPDHATFDTQPIASGSFGAMEGALRHYLARTFADRRAIRAKIEALGGSAGMTASELLTAYGLANAQEVLRAARSAIADYVRLKRVRLDELRAVFVDIPAREMDKRDGLGWAEAFTRNDPIFVTDAIFAEDEQTLAFLTRNMGQWHIHEGRYTFRRPKDQERFRRYLMRRQSLEESGGVSRPEGAEAEE